MNKELHSKIHTNMHRDTFTFKGLLTKLDNKEILIKRRNLYDTTLRRKGRTHTRSGSENRKDRRARESIIPGKNPGFDSFESVSTDNRSSTTPFISDEIWQILSRKNNLPPYRGLSPIGPEEVRESDLSSIKRYAVDSDVTGRYFTALLCSSAKTVGQEFGFSSFDNDSYIRRDINDIVKSGIRNTSAGWPTFRKKNTDVAIEDAVRWLKNFSKYPLFRKIIVNPLIFNPNFIAHRYQASYNKKTSKIDTKIRQVWMQPFRILCLEIKFFKGIIDRTIDLMSYSKNPVYAAGMRNIEISSQVERFRNKLAHSRRYKGRKKSLFSLDYSKYDSTIPITFLDIYFEMIKDSLKLSEREQREYDLLRFYSKYSPYIYDKKIHFQRRGINSGSLLTNNFDTFVNCTLLQCTKFIMEDKPLVNAILKTGDFENSLRKYFNFNEIAHFETPLRTDMITMGDDALVLFDNTELRVLKQLCKQLGMEVGVKFVCNNIDNPIFFLGRYWNSRNEPYQTDSYLMSHCLYRERYYNKKDVDIDISDELEPIRILSICSSLSNGMEFIDKYFHDYEKLNRLIRTRYKIPLLKDVFPFEGIQYIHISSLNDWRNF